MNYIEQITKYLTDHNREDEIPFVLLSAKVQGADHRERFVLLEDTRSNEELDINELLLWSETKEGHEYWRLIHAHTKPELD